MHGPHARASICDATSSQLAPVNNASDRIRLFMKRRVARAKREGSWYILSRQERSLLSLALRLKVKFQSLDLVRAVVSVFKKLQQVGNSLYGELIRGTRLAWVFADAAVSWGHPAARVWRNDLRFISFLGRFFSSSQAGDIGA